MARFLDDPSTAVNTFDALWVKELRAENDANGNTIYLGYAKAGSATSDAVWMIKKFTYDANDTATRGQLANDNASFSFVWDDRATYFT
jgi:hypothetical protein